MHSVLKSISLPRDPLFSLLKIKPIATPAGLETECSVGGIWKKWTWLDSNSSSVSYLLFDLRQVT